MSDTPMTDAAEWGITPHDMVVRSGLARKLERERNDYHERLSAAQRELAAVKQTMGELCESCGWAMRLPDEPCRCELERERDEARETLESLTTTALDLLASLGRAREETDEAQAQRDRLAEAVESFLSQQVAPLAPLREALAAVKGGFANAQDQGHSPAKEKL
jgi:DNA-binding protein H-NS